MVLSAVRHHLCEREPPLWVSQERPTNPSGLKFILGCPPQLLVYVDNSVNYTRYIHSHLYNKLLLVNSELTVRKTSFIPCINTSKYE